MKILFLLSLFIYSINLKYCERDLMHTHGLRGYHKAKEELNPYCQTIKWNCCKKKDLIKIYEQYTTQLVPTLDNFYAQMRSNLQKLSKIHDKMASIQYKDSENQKKKFYCQKAQSEFQAYNFQTLFKNLHQGLEKSILEFRPFHQSYYCALCDAEAHKNFDLQARKINLDSRNCTNHIRNNKSFISALNIQLIEYLEKMQNLLDCGFYDRHYEFPFLFDYLDQFKQQTKICLNNFDEESNEISENCKILCNNLNIAGIAPHYEGDPKFLEKALDYYENLIEEIELEKLKNAANPNDPKKTPKYNPMIHIDEMNHREPPVSVKLVGNNQASRLLKQIKENRKYADIFDKNKKKAIKRSGPRILEEQRKSYIRKLIKQEQKLSRLLAAETTQPTQNNQTEQEQATTNTISPQELKHYKDIYENMSIKFHPDSQEVFKRTIDPYDIQKFEKFYLYEQGLNLFDYLKGLNFDLNKDEILRTVHGHKKKETLDYNSQVILDSIKQPSIKNILDDLTNDCLFQIPQELQNKNHQSFLLLPSAELEHEELMTKIQEEVDKEIKNKEEQEQKDKEEKQNAKQELEKSQTATPPTNQTDTNKKS